MKLRRIRWAMFLVLLVITAGCHAIQPQHNLPPSQRLMEPGPGVGGPGPGVLQPAYPPMPQALLRPAPTVQVAFLGPDAMQINWDVMGVGQYDSDPLITPARHNFPQGGHYRLKITGIPEREDISLYPTIEIAPITARTQSYLDHTPIPVQFTESDFQQALSGNYVTKVIYLPDPEYQDLSAGVETLVSTRLEPGVDPLVEADRRGSIMAVIRMGNKDMEMPGAGGQGGGMGGGMAGFPMHMQGMSLPPNYVAGVTAPQYGMPMSGTPIGLPGPPHIPLGVPAGLQKHVIRNRTRMHIPEPTEKLKINVRQTPGMSYPKPPSRVFIREQSLHPAAPFHQPAGNVFQGQQ